MVRGRGRCTLRSIPYRLTEPYLAHVYLLVKGIRIESMSDPDPIQIWIQPTNAASRLSKSSLSEKIFKSDVFSFTRLTCEKKGRQSKS